MQTRDIISTTAERLLRTVGPDGFSFADLAKAADIRKASVHHHFPTKADMTASVLNDYVLRFWADLNTLPATASGADKLKKLARMYFDAMEDGSKLCLCVALSVTPGSLSDTATATVQQFHKDLADWTMAAMGTAHRDPALAFLSSLQGAQVLARSFDGSATFTALADQALTQAFSHMDGGPHGTEF